MSKFDVKTLISALKSLEKGGNRSGSNKSKPARAKNNLSQSANSKVKYANLTQKYKGSKKVLKPTDNNRILLDLRGSKKNNKICLYIRGNDPELVFRTYLYTSANDINSVKLSEKVTELINYLTSVSESISELLPHSLRTGPLGEVVPSVTISAASDEQYKLRLNRSFIKEKPALAVSTKEKEPATEA